MAHFAFLKTKNHERARPAPPPEREPFPHFFLSEKQRPEIARDPGRDPCEPLKGFTWKIARKNDFDTKTE